jgi:predicted transcriptional regulator
MAMTLRLTDDETAALRSFADETGRSMQEVARDAIREYVGRRNAHRDELLARIVDEDRPLLDLLAQ